MKKYIILLVTVFVFSVTAGIFGFLTNGDGINPFMVTFVTGALLGMLVAGFMKILEDY